MAHTQFKESSHLRYACYGVPQTSGLYGRGKKYDFHSILHCTILLVHARRRNPTEPKRVNRYGNIQHYLARIAAHDDEGLGIHYDENEDPSPAQCWKILLHHEKYHHGHSNYSFDVYIVFTGDGRVSGPSRVTVRSCDVCMYV